MAAEMLSVLIMVTVHGHQTLDGILIYQQILKALHQILYIAWGVLLRINGQVSGGQLSGPGICTVEDSALRYMYGSIPGTLLCMLSTSRHDP